MGANQYTKGPLSKDQTRFCVLCGERFVCGYQTRRVFCSMACSGRSRRAGLDVECQGCGKTIYAAANRLGRKKYCSKTCRSSAVNHVVQTQLGVGHCVLCGAEYINRIGPAARQKYCSRSCAKTAGDELNNKRRRELRQAGIRLSSRDWRRKAHDYYFKRCAICGFDTITEVHHILPRTDGGTDDPDNLIVLCPNHHAMADRGMLTTESLVAAARSNVKQSPLFAEV